MAYSEYSQCRFTVEFQGVELGAPKRPNCDKSGESATVVFPALA